ncbi:MAG: transporter substrate-binding domain-containing protein [Desulfobacterales bacterium]
MNIFLTKRCAIFSAVFIILALMLLCAPLIGAKEKDISTNNPPVASAAEIDYPPFSFIDRDGKANGFSVELMREALSAMDRDVVFRKGPWPEVRQWLEKGEVQALPLVGRTSEREPLFDFTFPYMSLHGAIVVRKPVTDIQKLEDLKDRRVAVMEGDNAEEFLRRQNFRVDIQTTPTFDEALRELSDGQHDAVVIQRLVALRLINELGLDNLEVVNRPLEGFRQDFCFAVKQGDKDSLALLNEGLSLVMADGTYSHLHAEWFAALQLPAHRNIVIGGDHNYPPFEYLDENGDPTGFNVAITKAIAREVGLDIEIRLGPWAQIREELAEGRIDVIQGMLYSPERDLTFDFTQSYTVNHYVSVVRKGEVTPPDNVDMLKGHEIVVQQGDIMDDFVLENGLEEQVSMVDSQEEALRELAGGKHDCALVARLTALYWIEENGWDNLALARRPLVSPGYGFAFPKNQKALLAQFGEGLKILEKSGELQQIRDKWLGVYEDLPPSFSEMLKYMAVIVIPLLLLVSAFFLWSWSLRKQVANRTRELRESENQYRLLADNTLDVIWTMTPATVFTYVNPAVKQLTGYTPEEWIGSKLSDHCTEAEFERLTSLIGREIDKGPEHQSVVFETEILHRDRSPVPVEIHGRVIFDENFKPTMFQGVTRDITQRKQAEQALRRSEALLNTVERIAKIGGWQWDVINKEMFWTKETYRIHGFDPEGFSRHAQEHIDQSLKCYAEKDRARVWEAFERCLQEGEPFELECSFKTFKGRNLWIRTTGQPVWDGNRIVKVVGNIQDITERKMAEEGLKESEKRFRFLVESAPEAIFIQTEGCFAYLNPAAVKLFGADSDKELLGKPVMDRFHPDYHEVVKERIRLLNQEKKPVKHLEEIYLRMDGSLVDVDVSAVPFNYRQKDGALVFVRDITEQKQAAQKQKVLEKQLHLSQRMEAVGRLAGGVAHDFNNLLYIILGYGEMVLENMEKDHPDYESLTQIYDAGIRAKNLTRQLLAFGRKQVLEMHRVDVNVAISDFSKLLHRVIGEDVSLRLHLTSEPLWIMADTSQVEQVLMNLAVNARDAMPEGGVLTIETAAVELDEIYASQKPGVTPGSYAMIAVSDTGFGMDQKTRDSVFEPFFTTKEKDKGTGLGLSTCYGIAKQHRGNIWVYSEPGAGTTFKVYFPLSAKQEENKEKQAVEKDMGLDGTETILVVEDDTVVRQLTCTVLEQRGYNVLESEDVYNAVELSKNYEASIHLMIVDVIMPGMKGPEVYRNVSVHHPEIKVLYMSGYTDNAIAYQGILEQGVHFIQKPFSVRDLAAKVRNMLD